MLSSTSSPSSSSSLFTGSIIRFVLSTLPVLGVLIYFLYQASQRTNVAAAAEASSSSPLISLMDIEIVFLSFLVIWTLFTVYIMVFIPKRRRFLGRYLSEGERSVGDVIFDKSSRMVCCGHHFQDYGYVIYPHPEKERRVVVRKRIRVYQQYTRERVCILRLPNRPLSGQPKIDIEIDLNMMKKERDNTLRCITVFSIFWVVFSILGAAYAVHQMGVSQQGGVVVGNENAQLGRRLFLVVAGGNIPFAFFVNWIRFLMYRNWMINRGALVEDVGDARKIRHSCLQEAASTDGSDQIPYSIMGEDLSYAGTLPSHSTFINAGSKAPDKLPKETASFGVGTTSYDEEGYPPSKKWTNLL